MHRKALYNIDKSTCWIY